MRVFSYTHQIFSTCNKILSATSVGKLFGVSERNAYRWSANPDYCESCCARNPIDKIIALLKAVSEMGRDEVVEGVLGFICNELGYVVYPKQNAVKSDKGSALMEFMDVTTAVGDVSSKLQEALKDLKIDDEERKDLIESTGVLIRQAMELKSVFEKPKRGAL